jgi:hypothetical protein
VVVERRIRLGNQPAVIVRLDSINDESDVADSPLRVNVPCWMLDQVACASIVTSEVPRISIAALMQLRKYLDQMGNMSSQVELESVSMMAKGDRHETDATAQAAHPEQIASQATDI